MQKGMIMKFEIKVVDEKTNEIYTWYKEYKGKEKVAWGYAERFGLHMVRKLQELGSLSEEWVSQVSRLSDEEYTAPEKGFGWY